eukprot:CAMPEP_0119482768 /NCGR_PEP_ID=MMETSP1344-20130328/10477_1 /TAXON_ID=236787 /ORGANISM="Florenciella parvula, Strain CCMP2471" /LENGTH=107 /DNA_ID=CAMNT_0007517205 /DNA_START=167 /DNA_END=490 /DNA_ORIENTATION=-
MWACVGMLRVMDPHRIGIQIKILCHDSHLAQLGREASSNLPCQGRVRSEGSDGATVLTCVRSAERAAVWACVGMLRVMDPHRIAIQKKTLGELCHLADLSREGARKL